MRIWQSTGLENDLRMLIGAFRRANISGLQLSGYLPGAEPLSIDILQCYSEDIYQFFWPSITYQGVAILELLPKFDSRMNPMVQGLAEDSQEVFLGWWPEKSYFIMGWDMESSIGESYAAVFSFNPYGKGLLGLHTYHIRHDLFYPALLEELLLRYPGMIGLRYD